MSKKLMTGLLGLVALAAMALPAVASASPELTSPTGTTAAVGSKFTAVNIGEMVMTDTNGNIINRCTSADLSGEVTKNSGTAIEGNVTTASFTGTGAEGNCTGTFFSSPRFTFGVANGVPWCVRALSTFATNEVQIRGGKCSEAAREIRFALDIGSITCLYSRAATEPIKGTLTTDNAQGQDAVIHFDKQLFKPVSTPFPCPEEALLDMPFTFSVGGTVAHFS
ncbi:MAG TPA: hypothetical protein VFJ53_01145 [Solirubrobacterales bacterium]|nr:hypothetical protein [Solirubrobacterales bacterium]